MSNTPVKRYNWIYQSHPVRTHRSLFLIMEMSNISSKMTTCRKPHTPNTLKCSLRHSGPVRNKVQGILRICKGIITINGGHSVRKNKCRISLTCYPSANIKSLSFINNPPVSTSRYNQHTMLIRYNRLNNCNKGHNTCIYYAIASILK